MMFCLVLDILWPRIFGRSLAGAYELTETLMAACVFLPLAWVERRGAHIRMSFIAQRFSVPVQHTVNFFSNVMVLFFFGVLCSQNWSYAVHSVSVREYYPGLIHFPVYASKILAAIGLTLMLIRVAERTLSSALRVFRKDFSAWKPGENH
jgi:TRAP-type C4-dicarboxylate transport system permease small subunit